MLLIKSLVVNTLVCFIFVIFGAFMISNANPIFDRIEVNKVAKCLLYFTILNQILPLNADLNIAIYLQPIRSFSKRHVTNQGSRDTESTSLESCRESLVCGHAYYDVSFTITSYRRSNR